MSQSQTSSASSSAGTGLKIWTLLFVVAVIPAGILAASFFTPLTTTLAILAAIAFQVIGLLMGTQIARKSTVQTPSTTSDEKPLQKSIDGLIAEMEEIAAGNLTIASEPNDDMTGAISRSVNDMTGQLRSIVEGVQSAAGGVTKSANHIRRASKSMSKESNDQASRINDASEKLLLMNESFQKVSEMTQESVEVAIEARETASKGLKAVSDTVDGMQRIRNQVSSTSWRIKRLGESSQEIGEIVQLISDIADRTSILALNASIQAAMAGDAGQGFAVVAQEMEGLAERSTDATQQVSKLIRAIQNETSEVISDMEESTREVVAGSELASQAGSTLFEIDNVSNQLVELIQASSNSVMQQADAANFISNTISDISDSSSVAAEMSQQSSHHAEQLSSMVVFLRDSVSQFTTGNDKTQSPDVDEAIVAQPLGAQPEAEIPQPEQAPATSPREDEPMAEQPEAEESGAEENDEKVKSAQQPSAAKKKKRGLKTFKKRNDRSRKVPATIRSDETNSKPQGGEVEENELEAKIWDQLREAKETMAETINPEKNSDDSGADEEKPRRSARTVARTMLNDEN